MARRVGLAMIGAGWWASVGHLPGMAADPEIDLVAVCDPSAPRASAAADRFGADHACTELDQVLAMDEVDGVVVATPHHTHHPIVRAALDAGKHVLVEKPMVTDAGHGWELVDLARARGLHLSLGLTYQYAPAAGRFRQAVQQQIGDLVCVNADFPSNTAGLFALTDPEHDHLDQPDHPHGTTFSDPATGGGQGYTQLCHLLGAVFWAVHDQATEAAAFMARRGLAVDLVDSVSFRLSRGGLGVATSSGTTPDGVQSGQPIRFHGTEGTVEWNLADGTGVIRSRGGVVQQVDADGPPYRREEVTGAFARLIKGVGPNLGPADDAAASIALIDAAYRSARDRTVVDVVQGVLD